MLTREELAFLMEASSLQQGMSTATASLVTSSRRMAAIGAPFYHESLSRLTTSEPTRGTGLEPWPSLSFGQGVQRLLVDAVVPREEIEDLIRVAAVDDDVRGEVRCGDDVQSPTLGVAP